tara:strand:- start:685 stop:1593 length:909 start_codon:yes stop_codon:yes gene_type:complete
MSKLPIGVDINYLIDDLRTFSWNASDILLHYSSILKNNDSNIDILKNININDPVTIADLNVNNMIIESIQEKYKEIDWGILSEENAKDSLNTIYINSDWIWVLDPLDGTKDFIQGTENYAMHLALNYKNRTYLGIVLIPEKDELWITNGEKIWGEKRDRTKLKTNISTNKDLCDMTLVTSKNHRNITLQNLIQKISFKKVKIMGSIGCKITSIIRGESDIYISLSLPGESCPKDWDFAAPEAILNAAGGKITNINNEELTYNKNNFEQGGIIIASNNKNNHEKLCFQIKEIIQKYDLYPLAH